jgi:hypothetical protein
MRTGIQKKKLRAGGQQTEPGFFTAMAKVLWVWT